MPSLTWATKAASVKRERVLSNLTSRSDLARFLSAATPEAAMLWTNLPNSRSGTRLSDATFTLAMGLRLGLQVASPGTCRCGRELDGLGDNALTCSKGVGRGVRHTELNSRICSFFSEAGCPAVLEPVGLMRTDRKRPDGVTVLPFERGLPLAWDATVRHTSAPSYLHLISVSAGAAAASAEASKDKKYAKLAAGRAFFVPVGLETLGAFGTSAKEMFDNLASNIRAKTGNNNSRISMYRRVAAAIQNGNAACILDAHWHTSGAFAGLTLAAASRVAI